MILIDLSNLNCSGCPAKCLLNVERIRRIESMRQRALQRLSKRRAELILLCESVPAKGFIYDIPTPSKLRANLRHELVGKESDSALLEFMTSRGIWVADCALCPLHKLNGNQSGRRLAATICLDRHTRAYLQAMPHADVIAIFPSKCGFLRQRLPSIANRAKRRFDFSNLSGLKEIVDKVHVKRDWHA